MNRQDHMRISNSLREFKEHHDLTWKQVAYVFGCHQHTLERFDSNPPIVGPRTLLFIESVTTKDWITSRVKKARRSCPRQKIGRPVVNR